MGFNSGFKGLIIFRACKIESGYPIQYRGLTPSGIVFDFLPWAEVFIVATAAGDNGSSYTSLIFKNRASYI